MLPFILLGLYWSCTDSELSTPGDEFANYEEGTYSVDIDGIPNDFSEITNVIASDNASQINGSSLEFGTISITLAGPLLEGTYDQSEGTMIMIMNEDGAFLNISQTGGLLPFTLKIKKVNTEEHWVSGTFSGTVFDTASGENSVLTNGVFYKIPYEEGDIDNVNRTLKGDFNDETVDFSTNAKAEGVTTAGVISGENPDGIQTLSITVPGGISEDVFTEENEVVIMVVLGTSENPNDTYSNYNAVTETYLPVSLTINSIDMESNDPRVQGTFSGTITKFTNGVPGEEIIITNGEIDVPIIILP